MGGKVEASVVVDRELWEELKSRVAGEGGLRSLSRVVEAAIEDEVSDVLVVKALEGLLEHGEELPLIVQPVKPRIATDAGGVVREMRESRFWPLFTWIQAL